MAFHFDVTIPFLTVLFAHFTSFPTFARCSQAYQVPPSGGFQRSFNCVDLSKDRVFVYVGTSAGEMMVFRRDTCVFRACIPCCTNGLQDLVTLNDDSVLCGGGDGAFLRLTGRDMSWNFANQVRSCNIIGPNSFQCL